MRQQQVCSERRASLASSHRWLFIYIVQVRNKAIKLDVNLTPVKRERDAEYEETLESAHVKRVNPIADGEIIDLSD